MIYLIINIVQFLVSRAPLTFALLLLELFQLTVSTQQCLIYHTDGWESTSLSEEADTNGEWVDVHHSSDEEQQEIVS